MATTSIRISTDTHARLRALSEKTNSSLDHTIQKLIDQHDDSAFWESALEGYRKLKEDPVAYNAHIQERDAWLDVPLVTLPHEDFSEHDND